MKFKMFNLKDWVKNVVKDDIKNLEDRVFSKKDALSDGWSRYLNSYWFSTSNYQPITLEEEISILQDRLDALEKHLKVRTEKFEKEEGYRAVKTETKKKK